jgi:hypothetical protein
VASFIPRNLDVQKARDASHIHIINQGFFAVCQKRLGRPKLLSLKHDGGLNAF